MSDDHLASPRHKITRSKALIEEASTCIATYLKTVSASLVISPHPHNSGEKIAYAEVKDAVPVDIALIVGDAIHNLRSALDHVAVCASVANGKSRSGVSFPFAQDLEGLRSTAPSKIKKLSPKARTLIYRLKPYVGGNDSLACLNNLDVKDKHQTLTLCTTLAKRIEGKFSCDQPINVSQGMGGSLQKGIHLFTFPAEANFSHNLQLTFSVSLTDSDHIHQEPVVDLLKHFVEVTERVVGIFERRILC